MLGGLGGMEVELVICACVVGVLSDRDMGLGEGATELSASTGLIFKP